MAAAKNSPNALHYSLIIFVLISIVLGVFTYMYANSYSTEIAARKKAVTEAESAKNTVSKLDTDLQELKKLLGKAPLEVVFDSANPANPNSVIGSMQQDVRDNGQQLAETTVAGTLAKLRQALDTAISERDSRVAAYNDVEKNLLALNSRYQSNVDEHQKKRNDIEGDLRKVVTERDESLRKKDTEISELRTLYNQSQVEVEQIKEASEKARVKLQGEIDKLTQINDKIRDELDEIKRETFEVADGTIRRVDNTSQLVWIDLGEADFLKPRMTFSVYGKDTPGVARTTADIKGKIEVTRVIDAHLAEAKMLEEDITRPMSPGDFIYTPLWSPGRPEKFAVVGVLDLDNDGKSDRALFKQELAVRGAELVDEVDDDGNRSGSSIDETIKYLILGSIPDLNEITVDEDRTKVQSIMEHLSAMRKEARQHGVRIIPLNAFLDYVGYKPKRRLFRPGQPTPYNLKAGAASAAVNEPLGDRSSSGQVSGSFGTKRLKPAETSSGQTSKLFGGTGSK